MAIHTEIALPSYKRLPSNKRRTSKCALIKIATILY